MGEPTKFNEFLQNALERPHGLTNKEIADKVGIPNANMISMFKRNPDYKTPLQYIAGLSKVLGFDFRYGMRLALQQYYTDDVINALERAFVEMTDDEQAVLNEYREAKKSGKAFAVDGETLSEEEAEVIRNMRKLRELGVPVNFSKGA